MEITIYTSGVGYAKKARAGWAAVLVIGEEHFWMSGHLNDATVEEAKEIAMLKAIAIFYPMAKLVQETTPTIKWARDTKGYFAVHCRQLAAAAM